MKPNEPNPLRDVDSTDPRPTLEAYQTHDDALRLADPEITEGWIKMWDPVNVEANR